MLKALVACHSNDVVHHDVKPENFIFSESKGNASLKLIDFGLAELDFVGDSFNPYGLAHPKTGKTGLDDSERMLKNQRGAPAFGTAAYMSPELLREEPYGRQSDIWSVGVILWTMLLGSALFSQRDPDLAERQIRDPNHLKKALNKHKNKLIKISSDARDLLGKMLAHDPRRRISAKQALSHPFVLKSYSGEDYTLIHDSEKLAQKAKKMVESDLYDTITLAVEEHRGTTLNVQDFQNATEGQLLPGVVNPGWGETGAGSGNNEQQNQNQVNTAPGAGPVVQSERVTVGGPIGDQTKDQSQNPSTAAEIAQDTTKSMEAFKLEGFTSLWGTKEHMFKKPEQAEDKSKIETLAKKDSDSDKDGNDGLVALALMHTSAATRTEQEV